MDSADMETWSTDGLLRELGGCGRFQVVMASLAYLPQISFAFTMLIMSYGAVNPGWRCLDNNGTHAGDNNTIVINNIPNINNNNGNVHFHPGEIGSIAVGDGEKEFVTEMVCEDFRACKRVEFNPEASTIITEWGLVCGKEWVALTMMALQMVGVLMGTLVNGFLGDRYGRKTTLYSMLSINVVANSVSVFSASWQMYMALRFLLGITCGIIGYTPCVFITEFVLPKWRVRISSLPLWSIGAMLFGTVVMVTKDWKEIHIVSAIIAFVGLLPVIWVPESLRWLLVKGKKRSAFKVARKISYWNRTEMPNESLTRHLNDRKQTPVRKFANAPTILELFRRSRIKFTFVFGVLFLSIDLIYFATSFGISSLPGNMYTNFLIIFATEMPSNLVSSTLPNVLGRRAVCIASYVLQSICLFAVVAVDLHTSGQLQTVGTLTLVIVARLCVCVEWYIILAYVAEIYPTVVRSTASGYGGFMAALGSIIAPYLVPSEPSNRYISYLIMAGFTLLCCLLLPLLPETKDAPLRDTWDKRRSENNSRPPKTEEETVTQEG